MIISDAAEPNPPLVPTMAAARAHVLALALAVACDIHPLNNTAGAQLSGWPAGAGAGGQRRMAEALDRRGLRRAGSDGRAPRRQLPVRRQSRRWPTSASCRRPIMRGGLASRWTTIRYWRGRRRPPMPTKPSSGPRRRVSRRNWFITPGLTRGPPALAIGRWMPDQSGMTPMGEQLWGESRQWAGWRTRRRWRASRSRRSRTRSAPRNGRSASISPPPTGWSPISAGTI